MNHYHIPYHLFIPSALCLLALIQIYFFRKKLFDRPSSKNIWVSITAFVLIYGLVVGVAGYHDILYQSRLIDYDLDKDGYFDSSERTIEQRETMMKYMNKTPRNLSLISGALIGLLVGVIIYHITKIENFVMRRISKRKPNKPKQVNSIDSKSVETIDLS